MGAKAQPIQGRFDDKWTPVPEAGCWLWLGATRASRPDDVRGWMQIDKQRPYAHRVSWELHRGPIPAGLCVCHKCDTPLCVNPDHLFLGTVSENNRDKAAKGRSRSAAGEQHSNSKLTARDVRLIRALSRSGARYSDIAPLFGVNPETISNVARRINWRHV